jgi:hypothetical protein
VAEPGDLRLLYLVLFKQLPASLNEIKLVVIYIIK